MKNILDRFMSKVEMIPIAGCWIWQDYLDSWGYGRLSIEGRTVSAHIAAYKLFVGDISTGYQIDHLCKVRCCVNPAHLEAVTPRVNVLRSSNLAAANAKKVDCHRGHPLSGANLRIGPDGKRYCRKCSCINSAAWNAKQAALNNDSDGEKK